jgi:hypothetical protein
LYLKHGYVEVTVCNGFRRAWGLWSKVLRSF